MLWLAAGPMTHRDARDIYNKHIVRTSQAGSCQDKPLPACRRRSSPPALGR